MGNSVPNSVISSVKSAYGKALIKTNGIISVTKSRIGGMDPQPRQIAFCVVCIEPDSPPGRIDLKFKDYDSDVFKACEPHIILNKLISIGKTHRYICPRCYEKTKALLSKMDALPIDRMPLYLNDPNIFIAERAKDRLKAGI